MSDANAGKVHDGEAEGRVQSPSHHLTRTGESPAGGSTGEADSGGGTVGAGGGNLMQDPQGNPAVGAAEDKSGASPSTRTNSPSNASAQPGGATGLAQEQQGKD